MNEELTLAIEELRQRPTDRIWFIPVKLNECEIPGREISSNEILCDLQHVNLEEDWDGGIQSVLEVIYKTARNEFSRGVNSLVNERTLQANHSPPMKCSESLNKASIIFPVPQ